MVKSLDAALRSASLNLTPRRNSLYNKVKTLVLIGDATANGIQPKDVARVEEVLKIIENDTYVYDLHALPYFDDIVERCKAAKC